MGGNYDVITELFLPRGSLVSDITPGDGKLVNLFYGVWFVNVWTWLLLAELPGLSLAVGERAPRIRLLRPTGRQHLSQGQFSISVSLSFAHESVELTKGVL
jgi:hypothetical protein